jgi:NitT/TauT family transport system substrate-binding protein
MIRRAAAILILIAGLAAPASAQERVTVGLTRLASNGGLFLAASQGYFKAEGLDVELRAFPSANPVARALAGGALDFGVTAFTAAVFDLAGHGAIKAIAAQARERRGYEGNAVVASNAAYAHGLRGFANLANKVVAISRLGTSFHYQLGQIARIKGFALGGVTLKPLQSLDAMARAVENGKVDAAILPAHYARDLLVASQAKFIGWYSELDEQQLGALFATANTIATRRATVEKFVRAYRRGVADYAAALLRHGRFGKRISDAKADAAAALIARYVYPDGSNGARAVETSVHFIDPRARIDIGDIARQIAWYKAQGLVGADVDARAAVDLSFTAGP